MKERRFNDSALHDDGVLDLVSARLSFVSFRRFNKPQTRILRLTDH